MKYGRFLFWRMNVFMRKSRKWLTLLFVLLFAVLFITYLFPARALPLQIQPLLQRLDFIEETEIIRDPYTVDYFTYSNASLSLIKLQGENQREYVVGDVLKVTIQLFDGYGRHKKRGGDMVRIWLREIPNGACSAGHVIDNNDGTYSGTLTLTWSGRPEIVASIAATREMIKIIYRIYENVKSIKPINAVFITHDKDNRQKSVASSSCMPFPEVPDYRAICNFTAENYGLPWYCGHPSIQDVSCFDWVQIIVFDNLGSLPFTTEEQYILNKSRHHLQLPHRIKVKVNEDLREPTSDATERLIPCNQRTFFDTWRDSGPMGFFYNWLWYPSKCEQTLETVQHYQQCLRNRRLNIYGDSTTRQWFVHLRKLLRLRMATEEFEDGQPWHKPCLAVDPNYNLSVFWGPHELPFYGGPNRGFNRPTFVYLDELPNTSNDIVVIHYYLHFVSFHPSVFTRHIRRLYQSVASLVSRAPNVTVAIKGPHAITGMADRINDYWGPVYDRIIRNTFRPLMDRILYMDFWDMTVAAENEDMHPNTTVVTNMIHYLMNVACRTHL